MSPDQQRIAIAEACGWTDLHIGTWTRWLNALMGIAPGDKNERHVRVPDYLNDLNAMHEAEEKIMSHIGYCRNLLEVVVPGTKGVIVGLHAGYGMSILHATAAQRAEAFLRTIGKWEEEKP